MTDEKADVLVDHPSLGFKVGLLTTLIGPAAGLFALFMIPVFNGTASTTYSGDVLFSFVPMLGFAYLFGLLPALVAGIVWGSYVASGAQRPWLAGMILGTLAPPLLMLLISLKFTRDDVSAKTVAITAAIGFGAAVLTELPIFLILRRSFVKAGDLERGKHN